jgi:2-succinyl-5-enolpyruvyl-6-hydroxy-3-cyclohexene-1-carboxylate synthase
MILPKIPRVQHVIAQLKQQGIQHIVISPGSRNAPFTIGFANDSFFETYSIVDERCAAFFGLGMAQQLKKPVALVCTSGSALLNYYPAIAEAFYSQIPLVIISADRPLEKIDIGDGQTIRQSNVFANHIIASEAIQSDIALENETKTYTIVEKAISQKGPVHLNVHLEEPLYETISGNYATQIESKISLKKSNPEIESEVINIWNKSYKKLILVGELAPNTLEKQFIENLANDSSVLVMVEKTANLYHDRFVDKIDSFIANLSQEQLQNFIPDVLVTFGGMVVSKRIKALFRNHKPKHHFHIDTLRAYDTYLCGVKQIPCHPNDFFKAINFDTLDSNYRATFHEIWKTKLLKHHTFCSQLPYSDFFVYQFIAQHLPNNYHLQVSNSAAIRYVQLVDLPTDTEVYCNRGTSGIDGSTSTAIGAAVINKKQTLFITGDISFFYDSNALWNNYVPKNFKIVLVNNSGGGIFRILPGHEENSVFNTFFETHHNLNASHLAKMYHWNYFSAQDTHSLEKSWEEFISSNDAPSILEVFTPEKTNQDFLKTYFKNL